MKEKIDASLSNAAVSSKFLGMNIIISTRFMKLLWKLLFECDTTKNIS